jgi:hypothetical protein
VPKGSAKYEGDYDEEYDEEEGYGEEDSFIDLTNEDENLRTKYKNGR